MTSSIRCESHLGLASFGSAAVSAFVAFRGFNGPFPGVIWPTISLFTALTAVALGVLGLNRGLVGDTRRGAAVAGVTIAGLVLSTMVLWWAFAMFVVFAFNMGD